MQIISSRKILFEKTIYKGEDEARTAHVEARVLVQPHHLPQEVPDWVGKTEHFELCEEDGTVMEVVYKNKANKTPALATGVSNSPKLPADGVVTQVAKIVGQDTEPAKVDQTGWGATSGLSGN